MNGGPGGSSGAGGADVSGDSGGDVANGDAGGSGTSSTSGVSRASSGSGDSGVERRYRRLLRWYPASWRERNGAVLLGTLLDGADAEGRRRPTMAEAWSIRAHGLGERLTLRAALVLSYIALACAAAAQYLVLDGALRALLSGLLTPALLSAAVLTVFRAGKALLPARATIVLLIGIAAWALSALAALSWSVGFDEADAGVARSPLGSAFLPLFLAAWLVGAVALVLLMTGVLATAPTVVRLTCAFALGLFAPPALGVASALPALGMLGAGVMLLALSIITLRAGREPDAEGAASNPAAAHTGAPSPAAATPPSGRTRRSTALLAALALVISVPAIAFAFFGAAWTSSIDSTRAMQLGLALGSLAIVPLLFAWVGALSRRRALSRTMMWSGMLLITIGLGIQFLLSTELAASGEFPWWSALPVGAGLGLLAGAFVNGSVLQRASIASVVAVATVFPAWGVLVSGALLVPLAALSTLILALRYSKESASFRDIQEVL